MVIATADSVDSELYINGTQDVLTGSIGKVDGSGVSANGLWEIMSFYGSGYLNGQLAEILVYPTVLNEADRQSVEGYLAHKWGTTGSLPEDHPYKTSEPTTDTEGFPYTFPIYFIILFNFIDIYLYGTTIHKHSE